MLPSLTRRFTKSAAAATLLPNTPEACNVGASIPSEFPERYTAGLSQAVLDIVPRLTHADEKRASHKSNWNNLHGQRSMISIRRNS